MTRKSKGVALCGLLWPVLLCSQPLPERITVSHQYITAVVFDSPVCNVYLASDAYVAHLKGPYLMLRCRQPGASPTSLFVTYGEEGAYLHTQLSYAADSPKTYDLRRCMPQEEEADEQETLDTTRLIQNLQHVTGLQQVYKDIGLREERMTVILTNVVADDRYTYLKLFVKNNSCIDYDIEEISFCYQSSAKKRVSVAPVLTTQQRWIAAYHAEELIYVLPSYGIRQRGKLVIALREARGERTLQLTVPAGIIVGAKKI